MEDKGITSTGYPLMLVFYMDRQLMQSEVMGQIASSINDAISMRDANAMAFFVPTEGEERIECINPIMVKDADMKKINKIVEDLTKNFDIGQGADEGKNDPANEVEKDVDEGDE
tara:strand:- start:163 stop:504 length:342 start_codon:yes stop_codon:yes gene_type:complete